MKTSAFPKKKRGMILPAIFCIMIVLTFLVLAVTTQGTSSLRQVSHNVQSDQAYYAADAGLARALAEYEATGDIAGGASGEIESTGAKYSVALYSNDTDGPLEVLEGISIPSNTVLVVATGKSDSTLATRRSAVLVQRGLGTVQVGSLAQNILANNSEFFAFDSNAEAPGYSGDGVDPGSILSREAVIATNEGTGTPVTLNDSAVNGNILVGPGGDNSQVKTTGDSTVGQIGTMTEKIDLPPIEVPTLPGNDDTGMPPEPQYFKPTADSDHVSFSQSADGTLTVTNQCFSCVIKPDGSFTVSEGDWENTGTKQASGNIKTGEINHQTSSHFDIEITDSKVKFGGGYHGLIMDYETGMFTVDGPSNENADEWGHGSRQTYAMPDWLTSTVFKNPPPDLHNPDEIPTGYYDDVVIDAGKTKLPDSTTVVIRDLTIENGGQLNLPADGKDVTIYVTGSLTIKGDDAILNDSRKASNLKIYYTGTEPVKVSGGASAFMTLIAPDAPITLEGNGSTFFGALATNETLELNDALFYYDVATDGVGTGTDGTTMTVLARQRF